VSAAVSINKYFLVNFVDEFRWETDPKVGSGVIGSVDDSEFETQMHRLLKESGAGYLRALETAVQGGSAQEISRAAHTLKSAVCYFDANDLVKVCGALEAQAVTADAATIQASLARIQTEFHNLVRRYAEKLGPESSKNRG
jgi:HPt (histidine-containing phosphotransfer) domain-containing protein